MTDEDFKQAQAYDLGFFVGHPFLDSCLVDLCGEDEDEEEILDIIEDEESKELFSLQDIEELMEADSQD